jgi:hypothetical protein
MCNTYVSSLHYVTFLLPAVDRTENVCSLHGNYGQQWESNGRDFVHFVSTFVFFFFFCFLITQVNFCFFWALRCNIVMLVQVLVICALKYYEEYYSRACEIRL